MPYTGEMRFRVPKGFGDVTPYVRPARVLAEKALDRGLGQSGLTRTVNGVRIQVSIINNQVTAEISEPPQPAESPMHEPRVADVTSGNRAIPVAGDPDIPNYIIHRSYLTTYYRIRNGSLLDQRSLEDSGDWSQYHIKHVIQMTPRLYWSANTEYYYAYNTPTDYLLAEQEIKEKSAAMGHPDIIDSDTFSEVISKWGVELTKQEVQVHSQLEYVDAGDTIWLDRIYAATPIVDYHGYSSVRDRTFRYTLYGISEWAIFAFRDFSGRVVSSYSPPSESDGYSTLRIVISDSKSTQAKVMLKEGYTPITVEMVTANDGEVTALAAVGVSTSVTGEADIHVPRNLSLAEHAHGAIEYKGAMFKPHRFIGVGEHVAPNRYSNQNVHHDLFVEYKREPEYIPNPVPSYLR